MNLMQQLIFPGDIIGTEEEFAPSDGAFAEEGNLRSSQVGVTTGSGGRIGVAGIKNVRQFRPGMAVLGIATDSMHNIAFVRIDSLRSGTQSFVALKDGKLMSPKPDAMQKHRPREMDGERKPKAKALSVGDVVAALIIGEGRDSYTLSINMPDFGVVAADCNLCSSPMQYDREAGALKCGSCEVSEHRKISNLYGDTNKIEALLKRYIK